ncbi:MAG: gamma-glutamylcyclotransferase, partial [Pseudonocardia sp.]|nr:gamma-glutamylcyclotransferase [Pseudonocardia sp.]
GDLRSGTVAGALLDTGRGYPAWIPDAPGPTPGTLIELRDPVAAFPAMDAYEGRDYRRIRTALADGTVAWAYAWRSATTGFRSGWRPVDQPFVR